MCLSTGGFGAQGFSNQNRQPQSRLNSTDLSAGDQMAMSLNPNAPYFTQQQSSSAQKPVPAFDYDLRELFSDEESATRQLSRLKMPQQQQQQQQNPYSNINQLMNSQQQTKAPFGAYPTAPSPSLSAPMPTTSIKSYQPSPTYSTILPNSAPYTNFANAIQTQYPTMSPFSDLDFLDTLPLGPENSGGVDGSANAAPEGFADFDMNFGMGWDGSLPGPAFEDGGGVDLFDGFFFGGNG